jgi:Arc/MetJ-type ribon-helix-helix transcriptional regulator
MSVQLAIRIPDETLSRLDRLVAEGEYPNRAETVRAGLELLLREAERRWTDTAIVEGYRRVPDDRPDAWLEASTKALVDAEPW